MKTYLSDLIPRIKRFSQKLDNITLLTNQHWVVIDELSNSKYVYIFRSNSQLLVSKDGRVEKGRWEYLDTNSILIDLKEGSYLFRHGFFDENVLALKVDGKEEYAFLVNENKNSGELNSIDKVFSFLENKYLNLPNFQKTIGVASQEILAQEEKNFGYTIKRQIDRRQMIWGAFTEYHIEFHNGFKTNVYKGKSSGRYFYEDVINGKIYCNSFEEAAFGLYNLLKKPWYLKKFATNAKSP